MNLVLASASERRNELLKRITSQFQVIISDFDENEVIFKGNCADYVMEIAKGKAMDVCNKVQEKSIIIGCDTIVSYNNLVFGKPKDRDEAFSMLKTLSGNTHQVYSGIALVDNCTGNVSTEFVCTDVKFSSLSDKIILKYIETGEPLDKAGAYGIQGYGGIFVEEIKGCYYNVVGLPLNRLNSMFRDMGVNL